MYNRHAAIVVVALLGLAPSLRAQPDCATALARASRSYDAGDFEQVIEILRPCAAGLVPNERELAYRYLALAHLFEGQYVEADSDLHAMLTLDPLYARDTARDPYELLDAIRAYDWYPKYSLGIHLALNRSAPDVLRGYSLAIDPATVANRQQEYSGAFGYAFGLNFSFHVSSAWSVHFVPGLRSFSFSRSGETGYKMYANYSENLSQFLFPLLVRYEFSSLHSGIERGFTPFLEAGAYAELLSSATSSIAGTDSIQGQSFSSPEFIATGQRKSSGFGLALGAGLEWQREPFYLDLTLRYCHDLFDMVNGSARYSQTELWYPYYSIDDDYSLRAVELSIGVSYALSFESYKIHE